MTRSAIAGMLIALATAVPAAGKGWPPPTGATICGASGCRELGPEAARRIDPRTTYLTRVAPRAPAPFYRVTLRGSSPRLFYYVPVAGAIRDGATWRKVEPELRLGTLRPFSKSRIARVRVDGRVARDPASYLALYSLDADPVQADPVARLIAAADLRALWRGWIPIELES